MFLKNRKMIASGERAFDEPARQDGAKTSDGLPRRRPPYVRWMVVGGLLGVVVAGVVYLASRPRTTQLTEATLKAAMQKWDRHGPKDYNLDLEVTGNRGGKIHVEVRAGEVTRMTRDGFQPTQKRTWDYWSVPGQFD